MEIANTRKGRIQTTPTDCAVCGSKEYTPFTKGYDYEYASCTNTFRIVQCASCSHLYLNPKPPLREFPTIYPDTYYAYDFLNEKKLAPAKIAKRFIEKRYIKLYRELIGPSGSILDVGCGDGRLLAVLKNAKGCAWNLSGIDFNKKGNRRATQKGLTIYETTFEAIRLQKRSFNLIIMNEVFEHFYDATSALKKVKTLLKPGGYFVIETPCPESWDFKLFKNAYWGGYHIPRHINLFTRTAIAMILEKEGFRIIEQRPLPSPPFWILSIHNMLLDRGWNHHIVRFFNFYNPLLLAIFTLIDLLQMMLGPTSTMRVIARKEQ